MSFIAQALMQAEMGFPDDEFVTLNTLTGLNAPLVTNTLVQPETSFPTARIGFFHTKDFFVSTNDNTEVVSYRWNPTTSNYDNVGVTVLTLPGSDTILRFDYIKGSEDHCLAITGDTSNVKGSPVVETTRLLKKQPNETWVEILGGPFPQTNYISDDSTYERRLSVTSSKDRKTFWASDSYGATTSPSLTGDFVATTMTLTVWSYDKTTEVFSDITGVGPEVLSTPLDIEYTTVSRRYALKRSPLLQVVTTNGEHCAALIDYEPRVNGNAANTDTGPTVVFYSSTPGSPVITKFIRLEDNTGPAEVAMMSLWEITFFNDFECHLVILFGNWQDTHDQYNTEWQPGRLSVYRFRLVGDDWQISSVTHSPQNSVTGSVRPENKPAEIRTSEDGGILLTKGYHKYLDAEADLAVETYWRQLYEFDLATLSYNWLETQEYSVPSGDPTFPFTLVGFNRLFTEIPMDISGDGGLHIAPVGAVDAADNLSSTGSNYITVRT